MPTKVEFEMMAGTLLRDWVRLYRRGIRVDDGRRLFGLLGLSAINEFIRWKEERTLGVSIKTLSVKDPVFVLGLGCSGTSLLHRLLACDQQFAFPTPIQAHNPHTFLTLEGLADGALSKILRSNYRRWLMNLVARKVEVRFAEVTNRTATSHSPAEDELAMVANGRSALLTSIFPRNSGLFAPYLLYDGLSPKEREKWLSLWCEFLQRLAFRWPKRRLLLKSIQHLARIRPILEVFPAARFVFISRDPRRIVQSQLNLSRHLRSSFCLQAQTPPSAKQSFQGILTRSGMLFSSYLQQKSLIPPGQLCEIRYEALIEEPLTVLEGLYSRLSLPYFETARQEFEPVLALVETNRKQRHEELEPEVCRRVREDWAAYYEEFRY